MENFLVKKKSVNFSFHKQDELILEFKKFSFDCHANLMVLRN